MCRMISIVRSIDAGESVRGFFRLPAIFGLLPARVVPRYVDGDRQGHDLSLDRHEE